MTKPIDNPKPPDKLELTADMQIEAAAAGDGQGAKLPRFSMVAYTGGAMRVGRWPHPVVVDLAGLSIPRQNSPIRESHGPRVGHAESIRVEEGRLLAAGVISCTGPAAQEVVADARNGFPWQASIGAAVEQFEFVREDQSVLVNGQEFKGPVNVVRKATLGEISFVDLGADGNTSANVAAAARQEKQTMTDTQVTQEQTKVEAAAQADTGTPAVDTAADIRSKAVAETKRIESIRKVCAGKHADIEAKAIEDGWDVKDTELAVLRAGRPQAPAINSGRPPATAPILEAALCMSYGIGNEKGLLADYGERTLTEADRYRRIGLRKTIELCAAAEGVELPLAVDSRWIRAAFSTASLPGILGAVANKALGASFLAVRAVAPRISRAVTHANFHAHTIYSMALSGDLVEVAPNGELKHLALSEESYTRQLKTRGAVLSIDRRDIINDELGAFTDNAARLGRKSAIARERATFLALNGTGAGASFFTAARANYFSGAATNLMHSSLSTAVQMFRDQTGPDGDPVNIQPRILLVPTNIEEVARSLMDRNAQLIATALGSTSSSKKEPSVNVWAGEFSVEVSEWLNKTINNVTGSTTAWYLLADPQDVAAVEISYLNGVQTPTIEYFGFDQQADVLGVTWRCYWDFGVDLAEFRAGIKSKGAA